MKSILLKLWQKLPLPEWGQWLIIRLLVKKFLVGVTAVIFNDAGKVLLFQHTYRKDHAWGLPGGWLKAKEDAAAAIVREIKEESGYQIRVLRPLIIGSDSHLAKLDLIFLCEYLGGDFRISAEVSAAHYFALDDLPVDFGPYQRGLIRQAANLKNQNISARD